MATLSEFFDSEAREILAQLERGLQHLPLPDAGDLHRVSRALRGTAQMAREERVLRAVTVFEAVARGMAANAIVWSDDMAQRAHDTLLDLQALVERRETDTALDARVEATVQRWLATGVSVPAADRYSAPRSVTGDSEFRTYAAGEVAGIADALDRGVEQLSMDPMDREPLKSILRRQRALLGAAWLDEIPVVAEILRAVEDLTRVIAKLDIGVKREWLDIYRVAREGLKAAIEPLQRNQDPPPSHALSRLRHMREELLERYGAGEPVSAAHEAPGLAQAQPADMPPEAPALRAHHAHDAHHAGEPQDLEELPELLLVDVVETDGDGIEAGIDDMEAGTDDMEAGTDDVDSGTGDVVPIDELCYSGSAALERALELHAAVQSVAAHDPNARAAVDELFDLIRLARRR
jgi:chemotaxis protein histidine kinase CheA